MNNYTGSATALTQAQNSGQQHIPTRRNGLLRQPSIRQLKQRILQRHDVQQRIRGIVYATTQQTAHYSGLMVTAAQATAQTAASQYQETTQHSSAAIGSGVVYTFTSEHTIETPIYKGALARALNATTGKEIWTLSGYTNEFSQTLTQSQTATTHGSTAMTTNLRCRQRRKPNHSLSSTDTDHTRQQTVIKGTVTDLSSGTTQDSTKSRLPTGIPVASDASMKDWMGYVYQQKPAPTNFTGVTVTIMALDPNDNYVVLGTTTTDANGIYQLNMDTTHHSRRLHSLRNLRRHKRLLGIKSRSYTWSSQKQQQQSHQQPHHNQQLTNTSSQQSQAYSLQS